MKGKMKKRFWSLGLVVCIFLLSTLTVFAAKKDKVLSEDEITNFKSNASQLIEQISGFSDEEIETYLEQGNDFINSALNSWSSVKEELGAFKEVGDQEVETDGSNVIVTSQATYENKTANVELIADTKAGAFVSMAFNVNYTMGEKMEKAALNTVMGIGIVFLMLLFLSFIIGLFKHVNKLEAKAKGKTEAVPVPVKPIVEVPTPQVDEEELRDDGELVAVIAAAIAAYEGTSTDGFVVRSIKKSNSRKWKRA